jgi:pimeloyl-ACP methyl ester carboxylesterase
MTSCLIGCKGHYVDTEQLLFDCSLMYLLCQWRFEQRPFYPGLGDSSKPPTGYDGKTVAEDIHQLVTQLGFETIFLVGHDIGAFVAYPYASGKWISYTVIHSGSFLVLIRKARLFALSDPITS